MASAGGPAAHTVEQRLQESPGSFDFFQAVRRLECEHGKRSRIGRSEHPREDPVRLCQATSLAFAPSAIERFEPANDNHPPRLFVNFMGLLGSHGPLPMVMTEYVYDRIHNADDATFARFLDVFNHRMLSMFYRAWATTSQVVSRDDPDSFTYDKFVGSAFGVGMPEFRHGDTWSDEAKLHYAGHLSCQTKHPQGLSSLVSGYFGVAAEVIEFIGRWLELPADCFCRVGGNSPSAVLGRTAVLGRHMWECQQKFRIRLGPMGIADYERLLAHTPSFRRLIDCVKDYLGEELVWDVQVVLAKEQVPATRLGGYGRLGWTTWLKTKEFERDAGDLVVHESRIELITRGGEGKSSDG
jgi:type VI secretion system protein ImpH